MAALAIKRDEVRKECPDERKYIFVYLCNGLVECIEADHVYVGAEEVVILRGFEVIARYRRQDVYLATDEEISTPVLF